MANGTGNTQGRALHQYGGGPTLQKILLLKLGDIDKGAVQKKILVHEKNIIIQLIKTVIFNRDTVGVLSFLLMVPASGTEVVQCHCGENLSGRRGLISGRR